MTQTTENDSRRPWWRHLVDWFDNPSIPADEERPEYLDWQR